MSSPVQYRCSLQHVQNAREKWIAHKRLLLEEKEKVKAQNSKVNDGVAESVPTNKSNVNTSTTAPESNKPTTFSFTSFTSANINNAGVVKLDAPKYVTESQVQESNPANPFATMSLGGTASLPVKDSNITTESFNPTNPFSTVSLSGIAKNTTTCFNFPTATCGGGGISAGSTTSLYNNGSAKNDATKKDTARITQNTNPANPFATISLNSGQAANTAPTPFSFPSSSLKGDSIFGTMTPSNLSSTQIDSEKDSNATDAQKINSNNPFAGSSLGGSSATSGSGIFGSGMTQNADATSTPEPFGGGSCDTTINGTTSAATPQIEKIETGQQGTTDYKTILTKFYEDRNPSKVSTVDSTLTKYKSREKEKKLSTDGSPVAKFPEPSGSGPKVFMKLSVGGKQMGRLVMQLYSDKTPLAAENFRALCTGKTTDELGQKKNLSRTYVGNIFHRVVPGFVMQGGDITAMNGTGGRSIYPPSSRTYGTDAWGKFPDECFMRHSRKGEFIASEGIFFYLMVWQGTSIRLTSFMQLLPCICWPFCM
jgi:cyclophilin family peptidyl-prolyl cis-trans isomerase